MQQTSSQPFGLPQYAPVRPSDGLSSLNIAPLDPGRHTLHSMQQPSGGNLGRGNAVPFTDTPRQPHTDARVPPGPLSLGGWASRGGMDLSTTPTAHSPRDLSSASLAAALQQPHSNPLQQQPQLLLPQTPTNRHAAIQPSLLPLLTPPQAAPSAALGIPLTGPHTAAAAAPGAPAAATSAPAAAGTRAAAAPAGDALQQLLSDPALLEAVLRGDWQGHGQQGLGPAAAGPMAAGPMAVGAGAGPPSTRPMLDLSTGGPMQHPTACSSDDRGADAVHRCVNAMRTNRHAWTSAYKCDYSAWINLYGNSYPALKLDNRLAASSAKLAEDMAATRTVSHVGADGSSMAQRIKKEGFVSYPQAENVAGGQGSALEVAADWMCSQGHRDNILSCSLDRVGTSTAYDVNGRAYYVQDFGCSNSNKCKC